MLCVSAAADIGRRSAEQDEDRTADGGQGCRRASARDERETSRRRTRGTGAEATRDDGEEKDCSDYITTRRATATSQRVVLLDSEEEDGLVLHLSQ